MEREFFMLGTIEYSAEWLKDLRAHLVKARLFLTEETTKKHLEKALAMLDPVCRTAEEQYKRENPREAEAEGNCASAWVPFRPRTAAGRAAADTEDFAEASK